MAGPTANLRARSIFRAAHFEISYVIPRSSIVTAEKSEKNDHLKNCHENKAGYTGQDGAPGVNNS